MGGGFECLTTVKSTWSLLTEDLAWKLHPDSTRNVGKSQSRNFSFLICKNRVQSLSHVQVFVTPWTVARQVSLSIINSRSLLKLMSIKLVMPSNHLILCRPLLLLPSIFPSIMVFLKSQFFTSGGQSIGVSASVLPMNIQD